MQHTLPVSRTNTGLHLLFGVEVLEFCFVEVQG